MTVSAQLLPWKEGRSDRREASDATAAPSQPAGPLRTQVDLDRGALRRFTLRFLDKRLEHRYQHQAGAESRIGVRITTGIGAVLWLLAAVVIPTSTAVPAGSGGAGLFRDGGIEHHGLPAFGPRGHPRSPAPDPLRPDLVEWAGRPVACVHGVRPARIRDQRADAAVRLRVPGTHRFHLCRVALGDHRRRLRGGCQPLSGSGQSPDGCVHLRGGLDRHAPRLATPRAVTPPRLLPGHRHRPADRRVEA